MNHDVRGKPMQAPQPGTLVNARTRVPIAVADYLIARSKRRGGEFRTLRKLSQAIAQLALEKFPWDPWPPDGFARPRVAEADPHSGRCPDGFAQLNLFMDQSQKQRLTEFAEGKGVSLSAVLLTVIYWWIIEDENATPTDPGILDVIATYWKAPKMWTP